MYDPSVREDIAATYFPALGIHPSPEFMECVLPRPRTKGISGGWQAGKSFALATDILLDLPLVEPGRDYRYWAVMPSYKTPPMEIDYLYKWCDQLGIVSKFHRPTDNSIRLELLRGQVVVETRTAQDPEGIASQACDGIIVVEAGQMPESIYTQVQGRVMTRGGWITLGGTLEDDEAKPRWVWYGEKLQEWWDEPSDLHASYRLPSWANRTVFPGGRDDPKIKDLERELDPYTFNRRIAGVPAGAQFPMYPGLLGGTEADWSWNPHVHGDNWIRSLGAGGHDYGTAFGHPSTLVVVTVSAGDTGRASLAVVREAWSYQGSDRSLIETKRRLLSQKYNIPQHRWGFDPVQKQAAEMAGATVMESGAGSRLARVGLVEARINAHTLLFDFNGPGVRDLFLQARRVHYIKRLVAGQGEIYDYARIDDDLVAALEDAMEVIDGKRSAALYRQQARSRTNWGKVRVAY